MLAEQRAAIAAIERISSAHRQRVRLGCVPDAGATLLPQTMVRFRRAFPSVELTVYEEARDTLVELLQAGELELAVLHEVADVEDLDVYPLYFDALRVVLPAGHRLTRPCEVTMTHLAEETWILTADQEDDLAVLCEGTGVRPAATLRVGTPQTAQAMAVAGLGIALGSSLLAPRDDVITRSVHGDTLVRRVYVAARRDVEWSRAMLGVHRMLERAASENGLPPVPGAVPLSPRRRASGRMAS
jgi:DNA-binding transcriptional LysR family regulator